MSVARSEARAQYYAWRGAAIAVPMLPRPIDPLLARAIGGLAYHAGRTGREAVRANLEVIAPALSRGERELLVRRAFVNQVRNYLWTVRLPTLDLNAGTVETRGWEHIEAAQKQGRGVVLASAHFGPIALVGPMALATHRASAAIVAEAIPPKLFELINRQLRGSLGTRFIPASAPLALHRVLRAGGILGVVADRAIAAVTLTVPFFGRETRLPVGHLHLAARTGAALIPGFAHPGPPPRGDVHPELALELGKGDDIVRENLRRWAAILERVIAQAPEEWHVFERMWPDE